MKNAILEVQDKPLSWNDRQTLRHVIIYGLEINLSQQKGEQLGISGEKDKPQNSDLAISKEQILATKKLLQRHTLEYVKCGIKFWTFCRPSSMYLIQTKDLKFYDRVVKYAEIDGVKNYKKDVIDFAEKMVMIMPNLESKIKIGSYTHRACSLKIFEHKTQTSHFRNTFLMLNLSMQ